MTKKPNGSKPESLIQQEIQLALQQAFPSALVLRQNTGAMRDQSGRLVKFGIKGQGDLRCVINGHSVEIEVKTVKGKQSDAQKQYEKIFNRAGGTYLVCTDAEDCLNEVRSRLPESDRK
jgi:hypothetical protein